MTESLAILAYLDRKFPEPPLFGSRAEEVARIWEAISVSTHYLEQPVQRIAGRILFGTDAEVAGPAAETHAEMRRMERTLSERQWLAGPELSAADIAVYPFIELLLRVAAKEAARSFELDLLPVTQIYPAIAAWLDNIRALPGYDRTYPPRWRVPAAA